MKPREIRDLETTVLLDQIEEKRKELFNLRLQWYGNTLEDPNAIKVVRRDIARMLTVVRERELAAELIQNEGSNE